MGQGWSSSISEWYAMVFLPLTSLVGDISGCEKVVFGREIARLTGLFCK